jgi:hypothetical protein
MNITKTDVGFSGLMGMGVVHESQMSTFTPSFTDPISTHIPLKIKENIWAGEYIDLYVLLKEPCCNVPLDWLRGSAVYCALVLIGAMETSFCMLGCETAALW